MSSAIRFTLWPRSWYAAELIGDEFGDELRSYSAIRVESVSPSRSGERRLDLIFYHANYPDGVRNKTYSLQTIERGRRFLLARSLQHDPVRLLLIYDISWDWLNSHFGIEPQNGSADVQRWLAEHC